MLLTGAHIALWKLLYRAVHCANQLMCSYGVLYLLLLPFWVFCTVKLKVALAKSQLMTALIKRVYVVEMSQFVKSELTVPELCKYVTTQPRQTQECASVSHRAQCKVTMYSKHSLQQSTYALYVLLRVLRGSFLDLMLIH